MFIMSSSSISDSLSVFSSPSPVSNRFITTQTPIWCGPSCPWSICPSETWWLTIYLLKYFGLSHDQKIAKKDKIYLSWWVTPTHTWWTPHSPWSTCAPGPWGWLPGFLKISPLDPVTKIEMKVCASCMFTISNTYMMYSA